MKYDEILSQYFFPHNADVFVLKNLPEVIKGTLFSRYSRTTKDIKTLFLDEFYNNEALKGSFAQPSEQPALNVEKAEDFYERVLVGYGDDSVAELGGAHIALENISMLATKEIEEHRIGLSPLEKSTRYVYYDKKVNGEYLYYRDPVLCASSYRELYVSTQEMLFEAYSKIVRESQPKLMSIFPGDSQDKAYISSIRAKACDIARSLLPLSALTNMGVYGNGRAYEYLISLLIGHPLEEVQELGQKMYIALSDSLGPFIKRAVSSRGDEYRAYRIATEHPFRMLAENFEISPTVYREPQVKLVSIDQDSIQAIAAAILYQYTDLSYEQSYQQVSEMSAGEQEAMIRQLGIHREVRQHKPMRAVEEAYAAFEIVADWGVYKDLMRHRLLTRHKKLFSAAYGYYTPPEIELLGYGAFYKEVMDKAADAYHTLSAHFPEQAQYLVTHGSFTPFYIKINMRALSHMVELRSVAQGHTSYRFVAQQMAKLVAERFPLFAETIFKFVDYHAYDLERLEAFKRIQAKAELKGVDVFKN